MAEPVTARSSPDVPDVMVRRAPQNQVLAFLLAFFAVLGVGAAVILIVKPMPGRQRIITIETPVDRVVERVVEKRVPVAAPPVEKKRPRPSTPVVVKRPSLPMPDSRACGDDPLCGIIK